MLDSLPFPQSTKRAGLNWALPTLTENYRFFDNVFFQTCISVIFSQIHSMHIKTQTTA
jgi:hypothetical protein